ncbi:DUF2339 domain-containing protein [Agarivorans sp. TSD2052]|uniref:DUF2339 domain-containing protein n=1 Tax=Agarivorans sp. TSD2052 TaxID=2937286 RepID=UPI00200ECEB6|nr:DUF2339 domain-containing protein [Agarivorans sp. TSD2052]UPW19500.1 DUF2339 domain-containing protein [Agarivorans sp. TSD2052]
MPLLDDVAKLKAELALIKSQQGTYQSHLDNQLASFSRQLDHLAQQIQSQPDSEQQSLATTVASAENASSNSEPSIGHVAKSTEPVQQQTSHSPNGQFENTDPSPHPLQALPANQQTSKPSALNSLMAQLGDSIAELSAMVFGPISGLTQQAKGFYQHYRSKSLGAVFLMTVAGIIALTLGFGYLLQFSINNWFSALGKALLGLGAANTIIAGGVFINNRRPGMEDFGSGLVGLGLILNYLCLYFLGPYFNILPASISFALLLANTIFGYQLSLKLDTKVVAVVALLGGSLAPLMLLDDSHNAFLYLPYLLIVGLCSLVQSHKLAWPVLIEVTAILHIACVGIVSQFIPLPFGSLNWQSIVALITIIGMFYLYSIASLLLLLKSSLTPRLLAVPISLLAFTLYTLSEFSIYAGELFVVNALICIGLYKLIKRDKQISALALAFAGSFAGFGGLYLLTPDLLGLVLLLEGLLLLWVGCKEQFSAIRAEAYVLLAVGIISSLVHTVNTLTSHQYTALSTWQDQATLCLLLMLSCAISYLAKKLLSQYKRYLIAAERHCVYIVHELLSVLYSATLLLVAYFISNQYFLLILPLIGLLLLHLSAQNSLRISEVLAWLLQLPLLGLVIFGVIDAASTSFSDQALNAKLARVELFISLLLVYYWYKKHYASSPLIKLAYVYQIICYAALPLLFLPKVMRSFPDYLAIALWLSTSISLILAYFINNKNLRYEAQLLSILAILVTAVMCLGKQWQGLVALALGIVLIGFIMLRYTQLSTKWQQVVKLQWHLSPYYFALVLIVASQTISNLLLPNWSLSAVLICGYFYLITERSNRLGKALSKALKPSYTVAYLAMFVAALIPFIIHLAAQLNPSLHANKLLLSIAELTLLALLARYLLAPRLGINTHERMLPRKGLKWAWHLLLSASYLLCSYQLDPSISAPLTAILLISHASVLMFISLRPQQADMVRLAAIIFATACVKVMFVDIAAFELIQKIVAFMVIGIILLSVSYFYQKAKNRINSAESALAQ